MKWYRLKDNGCPKCDCKLHPLMTGRLIVCNSKKCDFKISPERMQEIVSQQNAKDIEKSLVSEETNQELLNNLDQNVHQ